jgi:hypothetical protein
VKPSAKSAGPPSAHDWSIVEAVDLEPRAGDQKLLRDASHFNVEEWDAAGLTSRRWRSAARPPARTIGLITAPLCLVWLRRARCFNGNLIPLASAPSHLCRNPDGVQGLRTKETGQEDQLVTDNGGSSKRPPRCVLPALSDGQSVLTRPAPG